MYLQGFALSTRLSPRMRKEHFYETQFVPQPIASKYRSASISPSIWPEFQYHLTFSPFPSLRFARVLENFQKKIFKWKGRSEPLSTKPNTFSANHFRFLPCHGHTVRHSWSLSTLRHLGRDSEPKKKTTKKKCVHWNRQTKSRGG